MPEAEIPITFQPSGKTTRVRRGTPLLEAAAGAGLTLDSPCGGEGTCGKCRVRLLGTNGKPGPSPPGPAELRRLGTEEIDEGFRLACQTPVAEPMTVEVPESSLLASHYQILSDWKGRSIDTRDPAVAKRYVEMPEPARGDDQPDLLRLQNALGPFDIDLEMARLIPGRLRENQFRGTAVTADGRLIDFEPGDTTGQCFAVAVDVGTTTLVAMLVDLSTGEELGVVSRLNPQTRFGDDVLTRILHAREKSDGLAELHGIVLDAVNEMIGELVERGDVARRHVYEVSFAGNTTMQQLLCRIDPQFLGEVPFVPGVGRSLRLAAADLGLAIHPRGVGYVLPVIGGFVGGDTVSGMLVTAMAEEEGPSLLVDIGTNGEIVLAAEGKLLAAATAAGPAFEGARIEHGMRGGHGAIEKVTIDDGLHYSVIGGVKPIGFCGSALIDVAAELLRHKLISPEGRMTWPVDLPEDLPEDLRQRVVIHNDHPAFVIAGETETGTGKPILLSQRDVRQLQLASGAIRAGIVVLLRRAGLEPADLRRVFVAGGFGNFIRRTNAQRIGLLPEQIPRDRIRYQGNASLAGARLTAMSLVARRQAEELARRTEHVDLSFDYHFQESFAEAMIFPSG
ncbi:MAG: DUF4445 domain-containing protein [Planctomycetes bacterium]|nr:DUF4445 domain-containing protein [Planctomycetota bacterium]